MAKRVLSKELLKFYLFFKAFECIFIVLFTLHFIVLSIVVSKVIRSWTLDIQYSSKVGLGR